MSLPLCQTVGSVARRLLDHLLPQRCCRCLTSVAAGIPLCQPCQRELPWLEAACQTCALPTSASVRACGECLRSPPGFSRTLAPFYYTDSIAHWLLSFKQQRNFAAGRLLSHLTANFLHDYLSHQRDPSARPDLLLPVPLHWRRRWQRGFNQSLFVARQLGRQLDIPVATWLQRRHQGREQKQLQRRDRLKNLRNSFHLTATGDVRGRAVAIVDDVMTTGATAREISRLLLQAGASRVEVWVIARTPKPGNSRHIARPAP